MTYLYNPHSHLSLQTDYNILRPHTIESFDHGTGYQKFCENIVATKKQAYYLSVKEGVGLARFPLHQLIEHEVINAVQNKKLDLIVHNSHEAFDSVIDYIYKYVLIPYGIDSDSVIFVNNSFDAYWKIAEASAQYSLPMIRNEIYLDFEQLIQEEYLREIRKTRIPDTLVDKEYPRAYLNLNRRKRPHRHAFVFLLQLHDLLDKGYVSYGLSDEDHDGVFDMKKYVSQTLHNHATWSTFSRAASRARYRLENIKPLYLDQQDLVTNRASIEGSLADYYENTYFSVISETNFYSKHIYKYETARFLSEKVFKSILFKHPFLVVSTAGILTAVRLLGYKTFSPYIDETYDTIKDDEKRMYAVLNETKRLSQLSNKDRSEFLAGCREIVEYNHNLFLAKTNFRHEII